MSSEAPIRTALALLSVLLILSTDAAETGGATVVAPRLYFTVYQGHRGAYTGHLEWVSVSRPPL